LVDYVHDVVREHVAGIRCASLRGRGDLPNRNCVNYGRDPKMMQVTLTTGDVLFLTYVRPIDNFVWNYRCRIEGNRVLWASEPGRWRDDPKDEKVFFEVIDGGKQLRIIEDHGDGSSTNQLFDRDTIL
jgi:hypothetical protein